jgi:alkanesulfonate monooxygenase SsuD/methylene tetrahydromethanopterin reductase-like flavin-dependent oxidoreductase (luciferase family)
MTYATNPAETRGRFEEALKLIVRAWTEPQPFGWQGRHFEYRSISIWPRPVQVPHPPIYVSGSSPESGDLAARLKLAIGLAFTTLPLASEAVRHYREQANAAGWEPTPDQILYRLSVHVAETDQQAHDELVAAGAQQRRPAYSTSNRAVDDAVAGAGYYGRQATTQRGRLETYELDQRIELGQMLAGSPDTVLSQIRTIRDVLGAGILDLNFQPVGRDKTLHAIELFGTKVLPRLREL